MAFATGAIMLRSMTGFAQPTNTTLSVMTYNLRYASATPPNAWPERLPLMSELITKVSPDLIGTQEGLLSQFKIWPMIYQITIGWAWVAMMAKPKANSWRCFIAKRDWNR